MATVSLRGEEPELFSGVLFKCGGKVKSWNKRFFVLKSDFLYYYKDTNKGALGAISLKDPKFEARRGDVSDVSWPRQTKSDCRLAIVTSHRTYCAYSMYSHEIEDWIRLLTSAREKLASEGITQNKLLSGGRSASSSEVSQTQESKPAGSDKTRPLSLGQPENYEAAYDAPGSADQTGAALYEPQEPETIDAVYALASPVEPEQERLYEELTPNENPAVSQEATPSKDELYEEMSPQPEPVAMTTEQEPPASQPLYDDVAAEVTQPLYEDIPPQHSSPSYITQEDEQPSGDNHPSLLSRADTPPLPPRPVGSPPLPPKDDSANQNSTPETLHINETLDTPPSNESPPTSETPPTYDTPPTDEAASSKLPSTYETPPTHDTPPTDEALPGDSTSETTPTYDTPPVLHEVAPSDQPLPTIEATPTADGKAQRPVPRRRSFSPNQQQNEHPVVKPRTPHGIHT